MSLDHKNEFIKVFRGLLGTRHASSRFEGQDERYAREMAEMEATIALAQAAPDLLEALDAFVKAQKENQHPGFLAARKLADAAITKARLTTNETTTP